MELIRRKKLVRVVTAAVMMAMTSWLLPVGMAEANAETTAQLDNPRQVADTSMKSGQKVSWDCVWFGSYPQREVIADDSGYSAVYETYYDKEADVIVDAALFSRLESATRWNVGWDSNGDITINGDKYHRIKKSDATYKDSSNWYYSWNDDSSYHYFKYEPVKWRVLNVAGSDAFLLADKALDAKQYNTKYETVTWENSTVRSWLNGYDSTANTRKTDYSGAGFIDLAFTSSQLSAVKTTEVINKDNLTVNTDGGSDTKDKIFLLSESEVYSTADAQSYGFAKNYDTYDESRKCKSTTYAKAMGTSSSTSGTEAGNCWWQLRSPGNHNYNEAAVMPDGYIAYGGTSVDNGNRAIRPALHLDISYSDTWSYAGSVCSNGTQSINCATVTTDAATYAYNGQQQKPVVTVTCENRTLAEGTDYRAEYGTNTAVGKGQITIYGTGSYTGIKSIEFDIVPADISSAKLSAASYTYSGKICKPAVTAVKAGDAILTADDYTVAYASGCKNVGKYKVTVKGKGNYTGTKTLYFTINPKAAAVSKLTKGTKSFKASWSRVSSQATGYQLQYALNSKFTKSKKTVTIKSYKTTSKTISKLKAKKKYYVKVRAYKKVGDATYYSTWSKTKTVTTK